MNHFQSFHSRGIIRELIRPPNYSLAYAELFLTIGRLVLRFDMDPFDVVKERDVDVDGDCFNGITRDDSPGIQATISKDYLLEQ